ncbi:hypothetical protein D3C77_600830 [compost metagenome]
MRFAAITDKDGNVRGHTATQRLVRLHKSAAALLPAIEQRDDLTGATGCELLTVDRPGDGLVTLQLPQMERAEHLPIDLKLLTAAFGFDLDKGHRVVITVTEQEGTAPLFTPFSLHEHMIDCADHVLTGAVVGVQAVQASGGSTAGP